MKYTEDDQKVYFLASLSYFLLLPPLFPHFSFTLFAPLCVIALLTSRMKRILVVAFIAGLLTDLMVSEFTFGLMPLFFMGASAIMWYVRRYLFIDSFFAVALFVACFSLVLGLEELAYMVVTRGKGLLLELFQGEFYFHPIKDALFSLVAFTFPHFFLLKQKRYFGPKFFSYKR